MISPLFTSKVPFNTFLNDAINGKLDDLQKKQLAIFRKSSNSCTSKTKQSIESLSSRAIITSNSHTIEYPLSLRFRDMRYTHKGKEKCPHEFIYFRPIYGHLLGGTRNKKQKSLKTIIISEISSLFTERRCVMQNNNNITWTLSEFPEQSIGLNPELWALLRELRSLRNRYFCIVQSLGINDEMALNRASDLFVDLDCLLMADMSSIITDKVLE